MNSIQQITSLPPGTELEVCPANMQTGTQGRMPFGWVIVKTRDCDKCCGNTPGGKLNQPIPTIKNIANMPNGSVLEVLASQVLPAGWVVTDVVPLLADPGAASLTTTAANWRIEKVNAFLGGTERKICSFSPRPTGWIVTDATNCTNCCGSSLGTKPNKKLNIKNINGLPIGTVTQFCPALNNNITPPGWQVVPGSNTCLRCCGNTGTTVTTVNIRKVSGSSGPGSDTLRR